MSYTVGHWTWFHNVCEGKKKRVYHAKTHYTSKYPGLLKLNVYSVGYGSLSVVLSSYSQEETIERQTNEVVNNNATALV